MMEVMPWKYVYDISKKLTILYGKDYALSLSLSRIIDTINISSDELLNNPLLLFTEPLVKYSKPMRIVVTTKMIQNIINLCKDYELIMNTILICDSSQIKCDMDNVILVKCDPLNARSRNWFIDFHTKQIGLTISSNTNWINNLDDLRFAALIYDLNPEYAVNYTRSIKVYDAWSTLKLKQIISKSNIRGLLRHFELWSRENMANEECLSIILHKVLEEIK